MDYRIQRVASPNEFATLHQCAFHGGAVNFNSQNYTNSSSHSSRTDHNGENGLALNLQTYWPGHIPNIFINHNHNNTGSNIVSTQVIENGPFNGSDDMPDSGGDISYECGMSRYRQPKIKRRRIATPSQRRAANIRERRRMLNLNSSFDALRQKVPVFAYEKRLSRIETLRLAITYIGFLGELMEGKSPEEIQLNLVWRRCEKKELLHKTESGSDTTPDESGKSAEELIIEN